jgi:type IV pilus assembly protein PilC
MAYHNLAAMLDAGVSLLRSLNTVGEGLDPRMRKAFLTLADGVSKGTPLAETMSQNPRLFDPVDIMLIQVAETSGNLPELVGLLSRWHELSRRMVRRVLSGLLLPILVLTIAAFVAPVPGFVLGGWKVGAYLGTAVSILLLFWVPAALIVFVVRKTPQTGPLRRLLDHVVLRIPLLGRAMHEFALSRFCWAFHMLCKAAVPAADSVGMAIAVTGNAVVGDLFRGARESVRAGEPICEGLSQKLPTELVEMWRIGEETGQLDDVTKRLADNYADAAEFWLDQFVRWFPRFLYLLVCIMMIYYIFKNATLITSIY